MKFLYRTGGDDASNPLCQNIGLQLWSIRYVCGFGTFVQSHQDRRGSRRARRTYLYLAVEQKWSNGILIL